MPVPAVMIGGMPTVSSGSQIVTFGRISGWKMIFLVWVFSLVIDRRRGRPPSRCPTWSARPRSARCCSRPRASTSRRRPRGRTPRCVWPCMQRDQLAGVERRAAAERDHAVVVAGLEGGDAGCRCSTRPGSASRRRTPSPALPAAASASSAFCVIGILATTASVTKQRVLHLGGLARLRRYRPRARRRSAPWSGSSVRSSMPFGGGGHGARAEPFGVMDPGLGPWASPG